jgi:DNA repair photolyase
MLAHNRRMVDIVPERPRKGRGAISNPVGRFEPADRFATDDGWPVQSGDEGEDSEAPVRTTVMRDATRSILNKNDSPDVAFETSINPYRGCEHGCIYCFARPSHAYLGLSTGLDFETKILVKPDAPRLLAAELAKPGYKPTVIALGTNTDPYQPLERQMKITRGIFEVLRDFNHPFSLVTKSALVIRDLDIIAPMAEKDLVRVFVSITTLDRHLANTMEPRASTPTRRLAAVKALNDAGVPTGVMAAPMIPALNDDELEAILEAAKEAGARSAGYTLLRLPYEIKDLFAEWLETHAPLKAKHVLNLVRETRGGKLNDPRFGSRMRGEGPYAQLLRKRFALACQRLGLNKNDWNPDLSLFKVPPRAGDQLSLL